MQRQNISYTTACLVGLVLFLSMAASAAALTPDTPEALSSGGGLQRFVEEQAAQQGALTGARLHIEIAKPDSRLAPCSRAEPFLVPGTRLWGRTRIGLRCIEGARWISYVPVEVSAFGNALILVRPVSAGEAVAREDFQVQEIELTSVSPGLLTDTAAIENHVAARYLSVGTALRPEHLRVRPVILQGDLVRVVYLGPGFTVEGEGTATAAAVEGQSVRVQIDSGRVISGTAREGHRVEIR